MVETKEDLIAEAVKVLEILVGHDGQANLRHHFGGDRWAEGVSALANKLKLVLKEHYDSNPRLRVHLRGYPESNGKRNWTALLKRAESGFPGLVGTNGGIVFSYGEYWNRVAFDAERARYLIGDRASEPHILSYATDMETSEGWGGEVAAW